MSGKYAVLAAFCVVMATPACRSRHPTSSFRCPPGTLTANGDTRLRLNHIQIKGTHNSYHLSPGPSPRKWNYTHSPIYDQLERQDVRQIELDVYWHGGRRGLRVYHLPALDNRTSCRTFRRCLTMVKTWSDHRRGHVPVFIFVQPKGSGTYVLPGRVFRRMEKDILAVFPRRRLITPDDVRGRHGSLVEAVTCGGWPLLDQVRGSVMFILLVKGRRRRAYTRGGRHLRGRLMFVTARPSNPYGVVVNVDNPRKRRAYIRRIVRAGLLVRTRADANLREPSRGDRRRLEAALASGAHLISTDFPVRARKYRYAVTIPGGGPARCNPVTAPPDCSAAALWSGWRQATRRIQVPWRGTVSRSGGSPRSQLDRPQGPDARSGRQTPRWAGPMQSEARPRSPAPPRPHSPP